MSSELEQLRAELEAYRQREVEDLRAALQQARTEADHFRREAARISEAGQQLAAEYAEQVADLRAKLTVAEQAGANLRRFGGPENARRNQRG